MIPLIRPHFPEMSRVQGYFKRSQDAGILSNFGPCFESLVGRLKDRMKVNALPVATGTAAIQIAVQTHFKRGSKIAIPDFTHIATLQAVVAAGCEPVLFPVSRLTWTMDVNRLKEKIREVDGVIVVSPFGYSVDFEIYDEICHGAKTIVLYDLAGGWGLNPNTKNTVCYSLHATKNFSCGEGGLVCFSRRPDFLEARRLINFDIMLDRSINSQWGNNLKMDELKCAVVLAHLDEESLIDQRINQKKAVLDVYHRELRDICIPHDLHVGAAPSLCVVAGMKVQQMEKNCINQRFVCKGYYPLLSHVDALDDIQCMGKSAPFFETCLALPSDVSFDEALDVSKGIKRILKL